MPVDIAASQRAMDQTEYTSNFWKPKAGPEFVDNFVRVLPPHESMKDRMFQPVSLHWLPNKTSFICPRGVSQGTDHCPICQAGFDELKRLKTEMDEKSAKDAVRHYWPSWAYYFTVVLLNKDGTPADETPKILSANKDLAGLLLDTMKDTDGCPGCEEDGDHLSSCGEMEDEQTRFVDYTDLEEGFMLNIRTKATQVSFGDRAGTKHDYAIKKFRRPTAFNYPAILAEAPDPTTLNTILDRQQMEALLSPEGQLLLEAPQEPAADPLAVKEPDAIKQPDDDGWGDDSPKAEAEPEQEKGTDGQTEPAEAPPAKKAAKKPAAKKKAAAKKSKEDAETEEQQRQRLREELTQSE